MVSFLPHLVVPALVALAFLPMDRRRILLWAPLAWAPDVDYVLPSEHRALAHSALVPLALAGTLLWLWRRRDPGARLAEFATRPGAPGNLLLAAFYVSSHLLMDVFQGGVVLLWPLLDVNLYLGFEILLDTGTNTFTPEGEAGTSEGAPPLSPTYPWFTAEHSAIAAFLAACGVAALAFRRRGPRPVVVERVAVADAADAAETAEADDPPAGRPRGPPAGGRGGPSRRGSTPQPIQKE